MSGSGQNGPKWARMGQNRPKMPYKWLSLRHGSAGAESGVSGPNPWFRMERSREPRIAPCGTGQNGPYPARTGPKPRIYGSINGPVLGMGSEGPIRASGGLLPGAQDRSMRDMPGKARSGPDRPRTPDWAHWEQACSGHGLRRANPGFRGRIPGSQDPGFRDRPGKAQNRPKIGLFWAYLGHMGQKGHFGPPGRIWALGAREAQNRPKIGLFWAYSRAPGTGPGRAQKGHFGPFWAFPGLVP